MMQNNKYLTFDDVLIHPKWSSIKSRMDVDTSGYFSRNVKLKLPIASANMRTVTDGNMCLAMNKNSGIGILHRYFDNIECWKQELSIFNKKNFLNYGISVGYNDWINILSEIYHGDFGKYIWKPNVIVYDVANAANENVYEDVKKLLEFRNNISTAGYKREPIIKFDIVVGNIATKEAASKYKELDIDGIKVGIGPGCFIPGSKIFMENGYKNIEDVNINDLVYTHDGTLQKVINKFEYYNDGYDIIEINDEIKCTCDHEIYVIHTDDENFVNENNIQEYAFWIKAKNLDKNKHILIELDI